MTSDASNLAEHVSAFPSEARPTPPSDDSIAASLRGFGPLGLFAILLIVLTSVFKPLSAILVLVWTWRSHTPWREIGYVRPRSWISSLAVGIVFGCAFKLFMKAIVMPLLGAPAINPAYHCLAGNRAALPGIVSARVSQKRLYSEVTYSNASANFSGLGPAQKYPSSCSPPRCLPWAITPTWGFLGSNRR